MKNWKSETCEKCGYRNEWICRKNPPSIFYDFFNVTDCYPRVMAKIDGKIEYQEACSEYKPKIKIK